MIHGRPLLFYLDCRVSEKRQQVTNRLASTASVSAAQCLAQRNETSDVSKTPLVTNYKCQRRHQRRGVFISAWEGGAQQEPTSSNEQSTVNDWRQQQKEEEEEELAFILGGRGQSVWRSGRRLASPYQSPAEQDGQDHRRVTIHHASGAVLPSSSPIS